MRFCIPVLVSLFTLSACGKKANNTNDASGNCTSGYILDHNRVKSDLDFVRSDCEVAPNGNLCYNDKVAARTSCDNYQAMHKPGRVCSAMTADFTRKLSLSTTDVHEACNAFRARYGIR